MTKKDIERVEWNGENVVKLHVKSSHWYYNKSYLIQPSIQKLETIFLLNSHLFTSQITK